MTSTALEPSHRVRDQPSNADAAFQVFQSEHGSILYDDLVMTCRDRSQRLLCCSAALISLRSVTTTSGRPRKLLMLPVTQPAYGDTARHYYNSQILCLLRLW